jgi:20S proteasome alpha/beta subunit
MTIAAGMLCSDGVLLCSDTEMTADAKFEQRKLRRAENDCIGEYVITGSGNTTYIGMFCDLIEEGLYDNRTLFLEAEDMGKIHHFRRVIREAVGLTYKHLKDYPYQTDKPTLELILGLHAKANDAIVLLHVGMDGGIETIHEGGVFIGNGAATAIAFSRILWVDDFSLDIMRWIAMFILYQAKKSALYCGGGTHLAILPRPDFVGFYNDEKMAERVEER